MNLDNLRARADLLRRLREFFLQRGFLEVETPLTSREVIPERHIRLAGLADRERWLQASQEMHHKRLLCAGAGALFEVTRSFRSGERGRLHNPEFTLVEWYRPGDDMVAGMNLLDELLQALLGTPAAKRTSYREAVLDAVGVDPLESSTESLAAAAAELGAVAQPSSAADERDEALNAILALGVEPKLGAEGPELLYHYPPSQAALARTAVDDRGATVAERFELYWRGVELANGYHELTDPVELRRRLEAVNKQRLADGSTALPMPKRLLEAMADPGLPACAGVALGFDRLAMLAAGATSIAEVMAFPREG